MNGNPNPVDNRGGPYGSDCPVCGETVPQLPGHIEAEHDA